MSPKFQATVRQRGDVCFVKMAGIIDEDNDLPELIERLSGETVVLDLGDIERINSCGVRDWVNWLGSVQTQLGSAVVLVECSPAIVAQLNLINNFSGNGAVQSFYVPYYCGDCDVEKVMLCEVGEIEPNPSEPPIARCDECDRIMEFDDLAESYFAFLASHQHHHVESDVLETILSEFSDDGRSRIRSRTTVGTLSSIHISMGSSPLPTVPSLPSLVESETPLPKGTFNLTQKLAVAGQQAAAHPERPPPDFRAVITEPTSPTVAYLIGGGLLIAAAILAYFLFLS